MKKTIQPGIKLGALSVVLACSACSQNAMEQPNTDSSQSQSEAKVDQHEAAHSVEPGTDWTRQISDAKKDLSQRTGVASDAITVDKALSVTWGSSALGCPEPDMSYTDAFVPGLRLLLKADDTIYRYHAKANSDPFYCPPDRARLPAYGRGEEVM